jgi:eukaryotic-like serine/threonine-protein kinase
VNDLSSETVRLLERLQTGDRRALADLFERHRDRLRTMVELRMDARLHGRIDASEVLQDGFLDLTKQLESYVKVHRDIKPSNLLLDTDGVVWITDFGLAKSDDVRLTQTGDILGTVRYMAPERFRGEADVRSDIYALGLTLYELLTLEPAFDGRDRLWLIEQVKSEDPIAPRVRDRRVPRDLETVILRAIDKDAKRRYSTAGAMADDLRRFLDDEPILARRQTSFERYMRWARRHPSIAIMGAVLTAVLVLAAAWSLAAAASEHGAKLIAQAALQRAEANHHEAEAQRDHAERNLYIARIGQAESSLRLLDSATARALLDQCNPEPGGPDRRGWEWSYLDRWCRPELQNLKLPTSAHTNVLAMSPDGRFLVVGCATVFGAEPQEVSTDRIFVIDLRDGKLRHELGGHGTWVNAVAFRPDGKRFAAVGNQGTIKIWDRWSQQ